MTKTSSDEQQRDEVQQATISLFRTVEERIGRYATNEYGFKTRVFARFVVKVAKIARRRIEQYDSK